ncbi:SURF1 family protein [Tuber brumale]|nr:SURF1 family protein [Tuber brumale]
MRPLPRPFPLPRIRTPLTHQFPKPPFRFHRSAHNPADNPNFVSIIDQPATLVRAGGRKHGPGLLILAAIPITAFALGTWQVQRLNWKTELIMGCTARLLSPPLPLPSRVDVEQIPSFNYRRVLATGRFRHDQEMLIGPRIYEGQNGYQVVTPLERADEGSKVLVNRGWISKEKRLHKDRDPAGLPAGEVTVGGLIRTPWKKNMFTPDNVPEKGEFYFPDVEGMARLVGAQPVWIEETVEPDFVVAMENIEKGVPIARAAKVNLRNNHMQYIVTWYALALATSVMFYILVRKPPSDVAKRVRHSTDWS